MPKTDFPFASVGPTNPARVGLGYPYKALHLKAETPLEAALAAALTDLVVQHHDTAFDFSEYWK